MSNKGIERGAGLAVIFYSCLIAPEPLMPGVIQVRRLICEY
jgi:hypothetical protein